MAHLLEVRRELRKNFLEWGVDQNLPEHKRFAQKALETALACHKSKPSKSLRSRPKPRTLSNDPSRAIEEILTSEVMEKDEKRCSIVSDCIEGDYPVPPYLVYPDKFRPGEFFVKIKWEFDRLTKRQLDPLGRFSFQNYTKQEFFVLTWFSALREQPECLEGLVFEALVSSHAIHNEACFLCKGRNTLRWNGGIEAPWTDMECVSCESAYEIKSKRNMEKIESAFERVIPGGSYEDYWELQGHGRKKGWKHFLVTVSRSPSYARMPEKGPGMHKCWCVQIAEIDRVLPRLSPSSFSFKEIRFKSEIVTKTAWKAWFRIPYVMCEYEPIVLKVLDQQFPGYRETREQKEGRLAEAKNDPEGENDTKILGDEIDALRNALKKMSDHDCWEDMIDEDS